MLEEKYAEKKHEDQQLDLHNALWKTTVLDEEIQALNGAKASLLEIESSLWAMIDEEIESRKEKRDLLKIEVAELKQRCDKILYFVNVFRQE
jgi:hypothetical protein